MANTLLDAQTNISNDTLREIVSESAFIGEAPIRSLFTLMQPMVRWLAAFSDWLESDRKLARSLLQKTIRSQGMMKMS